MLCVEVTSVSGLGGACVCVWRCVVQEVLMCACVFSLSHPTYMHIHTHTYTCTHMHTHTCTHTHAHTHIHTHTHMHTHLLISMLAASDIPCPCKVVCCEIGDHRLGT